MQPDPAAAHGTILRNDPRLEALVPGDARIEKIAGDFRFTEGPIYIPAGHLLFSDIPANTIYKWTHDGAVTVFRKPSGFDGEGAPEGALIGSNGLTIDAQGRLLLCEHGNRRVSRLEEDGTLTVLADRYKGKRLNSPNDLVHKSDGTLYFTDPPYGLPKQDEDPQKELPFNGVFLLRGGELRLLHKEMTRPNGLMFSLDERILYVGNSDPARRMWLQFPVAADGALGTPTLFFDVSAEKGAGNPDGMKLDTRGNLYCTGPGGIWIFTPAGEHLGTIQPPEIPANLHWGPYAPGDTAADTLYITARTGLYRIRLAVTGVSPAAAFPVQSLP